MHQLPGFQQPPMPMMNMQAARKIPSLRMALPGSQQSLKDNADPAMKLINSNAGPQQKNQPGMVKRDLTDKEQPEAEQSHIIKKDAPEVEEFRQ
jgi:hypothetical protein